MNVTWGLEKAVCRPNTITTLGSYDGVHRGHQYILERLLERKHTMDLDRSVLLTFHPHPQEVLPRKGGPIELLTTIDERLALIAQCGIDEAIVIEFTPEFAQTSYIDFFRNVIAGQLGTKAMVVGYNHAFGKGRQGDAEHLKQLAPTLGITVEEVPPVELDHVAISSSKIRQALLAGDVLQANTWLGRDYAFSGTVVHGDKLGRELGYPTANIRVEAPKLVPADGVYAARVTMADGNRHSGSQHFTAALSIGTKPTITNTGERTIEALLLDFQGDLYGQLLTIDCTRYLRPQQKFSTIGALKAAIAQDVSSILQESPPR